MPGPQPDCPEATVLTEAKNGIGSFPINVQESSSDLRRVHPDQQSGFVGSAGQGGREGRGQSQIERSGRLSNNLEAFLP